MSQVIRTVRTFAGTVTAASPEFEGMVAPATLTLIEREHNYECRFVFFAGTPVPITFTAPKTGGVEIRGKAADPRGWDVAFTARLQGRRVMGTYDQPHDRGSFELDEV